MSSRKALGICLLGLLLLTASTGAAEYKFNNRKSTPGNDIQCGQKGQDGKLLPYCKICTGGLSALAAACDANPECKGFDMEGGFCGYLKSASGSSKLTYTEGFSNYCKVGAAGCQGDYTVRLRTDIVGNQINCGSKNYKGEALDYCKVSGNPVDAAAACSANPSCKAFVVNTLQSFESQLKSGADKTTYTEGSTTFIKN